MSDTHDSTPHPYLDIRTDIASYIVSSTSKETMYRAGFSAKTNSPAIDAMIAAHFPLAIRTRQYQSGREIVYEWRLTAEANDGLEALWTDVRPLIGGAS